MMALSARVGTRENEKSKQDRCRQVFGGLDSYTIKGKAAVWGRFVGCFSGSGTTVQVIRLGSIDTEFEQEVLSGGYDVL